MPYREEYINTVVAQVLSRLLGVEVDAEVTGRQDRRLLDFQISKHKLVLEAKIDNFPAAVQAAQNRWENMKPPPDVVGALSYHSDFKQNPQKAIVEDKPIEFALSGNRFGDLAAGKRIGTVFDLAQSMRRPAAIIDPNTDEVEQAVNAIQGGLAEFWGVIKNDKGTLHKMARILQANFDGNKKDEVLEQSARVGGLILLGALLFQIALARTNESVNPPASQSVETLRTHWRFILEKINYVAIFGVAERLLKECSIESNAVDILVHTAGMLEEAARDGLDLMGRIYHQLLADAKPLGAFYTSIPAATLMAGLALNAKDWGKDKQWADTNFIKDFRIADPACGSGTLLAAACWQIRDNFSRADAKINGIVLGGKKSEHPLNLIQKILLEESIWGYDILETAGHLTATTLGLMAPDVDFHKAHIYRTIIGDSESGIAAGSLEMLEGMPIFIREKQVETSQRADELPELDLCIMNPPFVRGTAGNKAYSFLGENERTAVQNRMNFLGRKHGFANDKGPGAAFVALACHKRVRKSIVKAGGRIAVILPATAAAGMGNAWSGVRQKIEETFDLEILIVSRDSARPNFSENTALQECIIIARKRKPRQKPKDNALFVVLHTNPTNNEEALATVQAIAMAHKSKNKYGNLQNNDKQMQLNQQMGNFAKLPYRGKSAWRGTSFANLHTAIVAENFSQTGILQPYVKGKKVNMIALGDIADIGGNTMHLKMNNPQYRVLEPVTHETNYAAYYPGYHKCKTGASQKDMKNIVEEPHCYVLPLPGNEEWIEAFYKKAGRIVINESFRFNTVRRIAALISEPVQASHYWPVKLHKKGVQRQKAMTLWLNSTPSLLLIAYFSQSTHDAKVGFSQKAALELPVLNIESLTAPQLRKLAGVFDKIAKGDGLLPLPNMTHDKERQKIDDIFSEICGLGDLSPLRAALAVEPIITNKPAGVASA